MSPDEIVNYIRSAAQQRGIDPNVALAVARSEGLNSYVGDQGSSFGPYQLHYGHVAAGGNAVGGLGDTFTAQTGLDARNPATVPRQIDFALDYAGKHGWGPWHGWKGDVHAGIGGAPAAQALAAGPAQPPQQSPVAGAVRRAMPMLMAAPVANTTQPTIINTPTASYQSPKPKVPGPIRANAAPATPDLSSYGDELAAETQKYGPVADTFSRLGNPLFSA